MLKRRELRVHTDQEVLAFNIGVIVESLQGLGMATDEAIRLARAAEKHFRAEGETPIALEDLTDWLEQRLKDEQTGALHKRFRKQTPPFVPLRVEHRNKQTPFSKRKLAESLEIVGLPFKQAYALSRQVEQQLRGEGLRVISRRELSHRTALSIETRHGRDLALRFEAHSPDTLEVYVTEPEGLPMPFSRGILARSLTTVGVAPEHAHYLAKRAETLLWRSGEGVIAQEGLRETVSRLLAEEVGEAYATRYRLMRYLRRPRLPLIVLVGGAPGVGKSLVAAELSYRLGIARIVSSDAIRQALRSLISIELSPTLHSSSYEAWHADLLPEERQGARPKRKRVTRGFQHQARQLSSPLMAIIERNIAEVTSVVIEGIHVVPGFLPTEMLEDALVVSVAMTLKDENIHRKHFEKRDIDTNQKRSASKYLKHFTEIRIINDFICQQAISHDIPVIDARDIERATQQLLDLCLQAALPSRNDAADDELLAVNDEPTVSR
jgi:2-phosphoglycerate kinase